MRKAIVIQNFMIAFVIIAIFVGFAIPATVIADITVIVICAIVFFIVESIKFDQCDIRYYLNKAHKRNS